MDRFALDRAMTARSDRFMRAMASRLSPVAGDRRGACHAGGRYVAWFVGEDAADRAAILLSAELGSIRRGRFCGYFEVSGEADPETWTPAEFRRAA